MLQFNLIAAFTVHSSGAQLAVPLNWPAISAEVLCQQHFGDFKHCKTSHLSEKTLDLEMTLALCGFFLVLSHSVNLCPVSFNSPSRYYVHILRINLACPKMH